ncbi:MAG TPA: hydrogen peroxide-dependent heme synthase [Candidatus Baltobacteraceae bacterium]|nr:hydrogen peroxide-dependent heme synthase [Candidatus Baltobacteraceae bacterium]
MRDPAVNETLEGWWILHRMFGFERRAFAALDDGQRTRISQEAVRELEVLKEPGRSDVGIAQTVGHSSDLMLTHYARSYDGLAAAQMRFDACELRDYLEPRDSYVSVLELGLYEATGRIHAALEGRNLKRFSPDWNAAFDEMLAEQAAHPRNAERLWAGIPPRRYVCFYPMDKKREGADNWYMLPFAERARLMLDHGKIGRTFHGLVTQVISGSIGYDDYEWGVDLYADDPVVFKKLVYEMRFDEASARYGAFGPFVSGLQFSVAELPVFLNGMGVPELRPREPANA